MEDCKKTAKYLSNLGILLYRMTIDDFCKGETKDIAKPKEFIRKIDENTVEVGMYNAQRKYIHSTVHLAPKRIMEIALRKYYGIVR